MKYKRIEYSRNFNIIGTIHEKILVDGELEEGDDPDRCFYDLKSKVHQWAEQKGWETVDRNPPLPVEQVSPLKVEHKNGGVTLEENIRSCTSLSVLGIYEKIIDKQKDAAEKTRLWLIYDEVYAQLTKTETVTP